MKCNINENNISLSKQHIIIFWDPCTCIFSSYWQKHYQTQYLSFILFKLSENWTKTNKLPNMPFWNCCEGVIWAFKRATKRLQNWFLNCGFQGQEPQLPGQHGQEVLKWEPNVPWRFGNCHCLMKILCYQQQLSRPLENERVHFLKVTRISLFCFKDQASLSAEHQVLSLVSVFGAGKGTITLFLVQL